jgi:antirestriction protein ArdC
MFYDEFVSSVMLDKIQKIPIHYNLEIGNWKNANPRNNELEQIFFRYIQNNGPNIIFRTVYPKYNIDLDAVYIPDIVHFQSSFEYYYCLFHELAHSTITENRLNRTIGFSDTSFEEIVAELSSAYITTKVMKEVFKYSSSFIRHHSESSNVLGGGLKDIELGRNIAISVGDYILNGG